MIQLAVAGANGRMGRTILELAAHDDRFAIAIGLTSGDDPKSGNVVRCGDVDVPITSRLGVPCDVLIDVSQPAGTVEWVKVCERLEIPLVTGVTGHSAEQIARVREASHQIPVVVAPNFSLGMRTTVKAVAQVARLLGHEYDIEIVEAHHRRKVDAPSGSAKALLQSVLDATGRSEDCVIHGREGAVGARPAGQIGVHAIRMGDVIGEHEVHFSGNGETITVKHKVQSRDTFGRGALRAAAWIVSQGAGWYEMDDVLGLREL